MDDSARSPVGGVCLSLLSFVAVWCLGKPQASAAERGVGIDVLCSDESGPDRLGMGLGFRASPDGRSPRGNRLVLLRRESAAPAGTPREQAILRLTGMYYIAVADGRAQDAAALQEALTALGASVPSLGPHIADLDQISPPVTVPYPQESPAPPPFSSLFRALRGRQDIVLQVTVTGNSSGTVWGTDCYTDDSPIETAAVHAGLLEPGQTGRLAVFIEGPQSAFRGTERHGVASYDYSAWDGSYRLAPADEAPQAPLLLDAGSFRRLSDFVDSDRPTPGTEIITWLTGQTDGFVWGSGSYTADSDLATAAVHAGALESGRSGFVRISLGPGRPAYRSAEKHGVVSRAWENYSLSFRIEAWPREPAAHQPRIRALRKRPTTDALEATINNVELELVR